MIVALMTTQVNLSVYNETIVFNITQIERKRYKILFTGPNKNVIVRGHIIIELLYSLTSLSV